MHVASRPIDAPVALVEKPRENGQGCQRVLVFQEGILPPEIVALLARLLVNV